METIFIPNQNFQKAQGLLNELLGPVLGVEMAAITGRAGRGKTTIAQRLFATNTSSIYLLYFEDWSYTELLREIAFRMCGTRPRYRQACFEMIAEDLSSRRRVIMVDEADRMNIKCLNVLRNIHDVCKAPILLIGEDDLKSKLNRERRLSSRLRSVLAFEPVSQADILLFFKGALGQQIAPEQAGRLLKHCEGDFRNVLTAAVAVERMLKTSGLAAVTDRVIDAVCSGNGVKRNG